jgi:hypothetical protein
MSGERSLIEHRYSSFENEVHVFLAGKNFSDDSILLKTLN